MSVQDLMNRIERAKSSLQEARNQLSDLRSEVFGDKPSGKKPEVLYAFLETKPYGIEMGAGFASIKDAGTGIELDVLNADLKLGLLEDDKGNTRGGLKAGAGIWRSKFDLVKGLGAFGVSTPANTALNLDVNAVSAGAEATAGTDGLTVGASASIMEGAIARGSSSAESSTDSTIRVGAGIGVGAVARGNWDDADHDGFKEVGYGIDVKFASLDFKTEDPLRTFGKYALSPLGPLAPVADVVALPNPWTDIAPEQNLTESAANFLGF